MNIGQIASQTGVSAKTIRYYESIGLLEEPPRRDNGYRDYDERHLQTLLFISRARRLGFPLKDVENLVGLWRDRGRASGDVKTVALSHINEMENRIAQLQGMRDTLLELVNRCHGDDRPDCPIIEGLEGHCAHHEKKAS